MSDPGYRRRNYHSAAYRLFRQFKAWRDGYDQNGPCGSLPDRRERVPNSTESTPRMGDMDDATMLRWAYRISAADAEVAINQSNEAIGRVKRKTGEAA